MTLALLGIVATQVDFHSLLDLFKQIKWEFVSLAIALAFLDRVLATVRWFILLRAKDVPIQFGPLLAMHLTAGFIGSFLPTSFGVDAVRIMMLIRRVECGTQCVAASVLDRVMMMIAKIFIASVAGLGMLLTMSTEAWVVIVPSIALVVIIGSAFMFHPRIARPIGTGIRRFTGDKIGKSMARFYWAIHAYQSQRSTLAYASLLTFAMLFVRVLVIYFLGASLAIDLGIVECALVMPLAWVIVMLPVSVGGFGLQEGAYAALMALIGIDATSAVSISLLDHLTSRLVALSGVVIWITRPNFRNLVTPREPVTSASDRPPPEVT